MDEMDPADVLDRAADALWMYGRCRDFGISDDGSMCVRGAISHVIGHDPAHWNDDYDVPAVLALDAYLARNRPPSLVANWDRAKRYLESDGFPSFIWNDRTEDDDEVIDTLRRCAKDLRS